MFKSSTITSRRFERRTRLTGSQIKGLLRKLIIPAIIVFLIIGLNRLLVIKKIDCSLNDQPCPNEITTILNRSLGKNSLFVNQKGIVNQLKTVYPVDKSNIGFRIFNTLAVKLQGTRPYLQADIYLVKDLPKLSMDEAPSTTDSASWWVRPSLDLQKFVDSKEAAGFNLWDNGTMTPTSTVGAQISFIFSRKPESSEVSAIFNLVKIASKYLNLSKLYIVNDRCFLSASDQPDIIVTVPFNEDSLVTALQSLSYLATIKKDAKVIDLSFKNPILR